MIIALQTNRTLKYLRERKTTITQEFNARLFFIKAKDNKNTRMSNHMVPIVVSNHR